MLSLFGKWRGTHRKRELDEQIAEFKRNPSVELGIAVARRLLRESRIDDAFRWIRRARASFPDCGNVERLYRKLKLERAKLALCEAKQLARADPCPENLVEVCDLTRICGQRRRALGLARKANRRYPDNWRIKLVLGKLHFHRFRETLATTVGLRAVEFLEESCALNGSNYEALILYAICLTRLGNFEDGLAVIDEILELWPGDNRALGLRAYVERTSLAQLSRSEDEEEGETTGVSAPEQSLLERIMAIDGAVGAFLFDDNGEVADSLVRENDTFEFSAPVEVLESMASACHLDARRFELGELVACSGTGENWYFAYRPTSEGRTMAFFEGERCAERSEKQMTKSFEEHRAAKDTGVSASAAP